MADIVTLGSSVLAIASFPAWEFGILKLKNVMVENMQKGSPVFPMLYGVIAAGGPLLLGWTLCIPALVFVTDVSMALKLALMIASFVCWEIAFVSSKIAWFESKSMRLSAIGSLFIAILGWICLLIGFAMIYPFFEEIGLIEYIINGVFK